MTSWYRPRHPLFLLPSCCQRLPETSVTSTKAYTTMHPHNTKQRCACTATLTAAAHSCTCRPRQRAQHTKAAPQLRAKSKPAFTVELSQEAHALSAAHAAAAAAASSTAAACHALTSNSKPDCAHILDKHVHNLHSTQHSMAHTSTARQGIAGQSTHGMCGCKTATALSPADPHGRQQPCTRVCCSCCGRCQSVRSSPPQIHVQSRRGNTAQSCCWQGPTQSSMCPTPPTRFFLDVTSPCTCEMLVSVSLVSRSSVLAAPEELCRQQDRTGQTAAAARTHEDSCSHTVRPCMRAAALGRWPLCGARQTRQTAKARGAAAMC
jgi:hypothetical protein